MRSVTKNSEQRLSAGALEEEGGGMRELPKGWDKGKLEDMVDYIQPTKFIVESTEYDENFKTPVLTAGKSFIKGYTNETEGIFTDHPVIIFDDFTTATKFVDFPFKVKSSAMKILKPKHEQVNIKYVFFFMQTLRETTDTHKRYWISIFSKLPIPLPPLREQRRIVARIEELFSRLDAGVAALHHAKVQLQRYRQSVLAAAVTGQLTQAWREQHPDTEPVEELLKRILEQRREQWNGKGKYKEPKEPVTLESVSLPERWRLSSPEQLSTHIVDCPHSTPKWTNVGEICLRTTNFLPGRLVLDKVRYVSAETYKERISRLEPEPGDILYSREGGILGLACVIPSGLKTCLGQRMMQFRMDSQLAIPAYFNFVLNSPTILGEVKRLTGGSASPHLNIRDIRTFPIPLPPLAEQHQIVAEVEVRTTAIDHLEAELDRQITRSNSLRQSTLAFAFSGDLY